MRRLVLFAMLVSAAACSYGEPPHRHVHEYLSERPSGFWTSNAPAVGGAYKYNLMYVGLVVLAITGFFVFRLVRRAQQERRSRQS